MNHKESFCSQESGSVIKASVSQLFNSNSPFSLLTHCFRPKPDKANTR